MVAPQCSLESDTIRSINTTTKSEFVSESLVKTTDKRKQLYLLVLLRNDIPSSQTQTNSSENVLNEHSYAYKPTSSPELKISDSPTDLLNKPNKPSDPERLQAVCSPAKHSTGEPISCRVPVIVQPHLTVPPVNKIHCVNEEGKGRVPAASEHLQSVGCPTRPTGEQLSCPVPVADKPQPAVPPVIRIQCVSGGGTGQVKPSNSLPVGPGDDRKEIKMETEDSKAIFKCRYCEKTFNRKCYRTKHINRVHKRTSRGEEKTKTTFECALCEKVYDYKNSLQRHVETIHFRNEEKCQFCSFTTHRKYKLKRHVTKVHLNNSVPTNTEQFECIQCTVQFSNKKKLRYHELKKHNIQRFARKKLCRKCPLCSFCSGKNRKDEINNHFKDEHNISIKEETYNFQDIEQLNAWKRQLEIDTKTSFIKAHYSTTNTLTYVCHRRGLFKSRGTNKRQLKMMGSCKINGHCPSEINAKINGDGTISVKYVGTHVGHKNELNFIRLRPEERRTVANQILSNTPHNEILKSVQSSLMNQKLQRIHLLSKKDIINIEKSLLNIGKGLGIADCEEEIVEFEAHEDESEPKINGNELNGDVQNEDVSLVENEEEKTEQNRLRQLFEEIVKNAKSKAQIEFVEKKFKETFTTIQRIGSPPGSPAQVEEDSYSVFPFIDCIYS